jgi:hypothetical protein
MILFFMKKLAIYIGILLFLSLGTLLVILYAKGYIFNFSEGEIGVSGTGLLAATSSPDGAGIYVNGNLTSATDNTINLSPGTYDIKISKSGYFPWQKKVVIEKEVVTAIYALLIPNAPKLDNITDIGVDNPTIDPSRTKIAYSVTGSDDPRENGIYILDMSIKPILTLRNSSAQIANDAVNKFSEAKLSWTPDAKQIIATISATATTYLLETNFNQNPQNITATIDTFNLNFIEEKEKQKAAKLSSQKKKLQSIIKDNFSILSWSDDETKILYEASRSAALPIIINPPLIGTNSTPEQRDLQKGSVYIYDTKEDKNFKILDSVPEHKSADFINEFPLTWFSDSKHLLYINENKISIVEHDGSNLTTVYAGPFVNSYVFPWPDGSKILTLTDLGNPSILPNLYTIGLK